MKIKLNFEHCIQGINMRAGGLERVYGFNEFLSSHEKLKHFLVAANSNSENRRDLIEQYQEAAVQCWHQVRTKVKKSGVVKKDLDPDEKYKTPVFEDEMPLDEETRWRWIKRWIVSDPHLSILNPDRHLGAVSEAFMGQVKKFLMDQVDTDLPLEELLYSKYQHSLMPPGDQFWVRKFFLFLLKYYGSKI